MLDYSIMWTTKSMSHFLLQARAAKLLDKTCTLANRGKIVIDSQPEIRRTALDAENLGSQKELASV